MFVRPVLVCLELLIYIFWHQILPDDFRSVSGQAQVSLRSLCAYFVRQTEPKILRLILFCSYSGPELDLAKCKDNKTSFGSESVSFLGNKALLKMILSLQGFVMMWKKQADILTVSDQIVDKVT